MFFSVIYSKSFINFPESDTKENINDINDSKKFWAEIKKIHPSKSKTKCSNVINVNDELVTEKVKNADSFCNFFSSIGSKLNKSIISLMDRRSTHYNSEQLHLKEN